MMAAKRQEDIQMRYRTETDSIGSREVPENAYYGIQSMRAAENGSDPGRRRYFIKYERE